MLVYDLNGNLLTNYDLALGHLDLRYKTVHHDAIEPVQEISHWEESIDGETLTQVIDVPGVQGRDSWDEEIEYYVYIPYSTDELKPQTNIFEDFRSSFLNEYNTLVNKLENDIVNKKELDVFRAEYLDLINYNNLETQRANNLYLYNKELELDNKLNILTNRIEQLLGALQSYQELDVMYNRLHIKEQLLEQICYDTINVDFLFHNYQDNYLDIVDINKLYLANKITNEDYFNIIGHTYDFSPLEEEEDEGDGGNS